MLTAFLDSGESVLAVLVARLLLTPRRARIRNTRGGLVCGA